MTGSDDSLTGKRILIIEDESLIGLFLQDTLQEIGCEVVGMVSRLEEAERAISASFDIAILDVNLNGSRTYSIAEALDKRGSAFIFSTGYDVGVLPTTLQQTPVLRKPFIKAELEQALRKALR